MSRTDHVLVVEDNDDDFETVTEAVRRAGITNQLRRAVSGTECVEMLVELLERGSTLPALVLLDLNTPNADGRDALLQIRANSNLAVIPLVVISASANPRDITTAYSNGANAYHIKPVNHATHLEILQTIFTYWINQAVLPTHRSLSR
ncbi:response regulator [Gemmatimonas groenlandica]|uniref:Response regulator n=1 Tax=Gemmatimonas groenlandica TaxID=2732249 RepID=A0A6M4ITZ8_9BACT|nr:response regulator [Gemmatimonas groenlandica]QJR37608.1 response regulator [Gemmatimonas groenlandica]